MHNNPRPDFHYSILVLVFIGACLWCTLAGPVFDHASAQNSAASNGRIAFVSNRNGPPGEIYVMNPDGSDQRNITNSAASEPRPAFSPDGKKIAFVSDYVKADMVKAFITSSEYRRKIL